MNDTGRSVKLRDKLLNEREELIIRLHEEEKLSHQEISVRLGLSVTGANYVYHEAQKKLRDFAENGEDALSLLPARARRVALTLKLDSRARARAAMEAGQLSWISGIGGIIWEGVMLRQASKKTWSALYEWAGRPALPPFRRSRRLK